MPSRHSKGGKHQMTDELISVTEAAEKLGVSPRTVQRYCKQGRLDHKWVNGKRHKELRIVPPISLDKLPGIRRKSALATADAVSRREFEKVTEELKREVFKRNLRISELEQEVDRLKSTAGSSHPESTDSYLIQHVRTLIHEFEKVRPAEKKLIIKLATEVRAHGEFLQSLGMNSPDDL